MKTSEHIGLLVEKINADLINIMREEISNPEDMMYAINHTYVSLFLTCAKYRMEFFSEDANYVEQRILKHLQCCFDEAKKEILHQDNLQAEDDGKVEL